MEKRGRKKKYSSDKVREEIRRIQNRINQKKWKKWKQEYY